MIETRAALDALDGILATPGIDGIFVGPADFSIAWTEGETVDGKLEDMMGTVERIAARAKAAGKHAGIYVVDASMSGRFVEMGYRFLALGTEQRYIALGAESLLTAARNSLGRPKAREAGGSAGYDLRAADLSADPDGYPGRRVRKFAKAMDPSGQGP